MRGHIHERKTKLKSGEAKTSWYAVIDIGKDSSGQRRQRWHGVYASREQAEFMRDELIGQVETGTYVHDPSMTLDTWAERHWFPIVATRLKPSTLDSYERVIRNYVSPRIGDIPIRRLTVSRIDRLGQELLESGGGSSRQRKPLSPTSVRYIYQVLSGCLRSACDTGYLTKNPVIISHAPRARRPEELKIKSWSAAELKTFLDCIEGTPLELVWHLAAMTGMRRGEVLGLRWNDVDLDRHRILVEHTIIEVKGKVTASTTKSRRARVIDLDDMTVRRLERHRMQREASRIISDEPMDALALVCAQDGGQPLVPQKVSRQFQRLCDEFDLPRIRFHDLRHSHASLCLAAGVPIKVVQERLGHHSPELTARIYAHTLPGMQYAAANMFARMVFAGETRVNFEVRTDHGSLGSLRPNHARWHARPMSSYS